MAYDQNVQYLSLAFWQIIMTAGPILAIALGVGLFHWSNSSCHLNSRNDFDFRTEIICCAGSNGIIF